MSIFQKNCDFLTLIVPWAEIGSSSCKNSSTWTIFDILGGKLLARRSRVAGFVGISSSASMKLFLYFNVKAI